MDCKKYVKEALDSVENESEFIRVITCCLEVFAEEIEQIKHREVQ